MFVRVAKLWHFLLLLWAFIQKYFGSLEYSCYIFISTLCSYISIYLECSRALYLLLLYKEGWSCEKQYFQYHSLSIICLYWKCKTLLTSYRLLRTFFLPKQTRHSDTTSNLDFAVGFGFYVSSPSASQRSTKMSTICGSGTFWGNWRGGPSSSPPFLHRGLKITSIISSTSRGTAALDVESVSLLWESHCSRACSHRASPVEMNHKQTTRVVGVGLQITTFCSFCIHGIVVRVSHPLRLTCIYKTFHGLIGRLGLRSLRWVLRFVDFRHGEWTVVELFVFSRVLHGQEMETRRWSIIAITSSSCHSQRPLSPSFVPQIAGIFAEPNRRAEGQTSRQPIHGNDGDSLPGVSVF